LNKTAQLILFLLLLLLIMSFGCKQTVNVQPTAIPVVINYSTEPPVIGDNTPVPVVKKMPGMEPFELAVYGYAAIVSGTSSTLRIVAFQDEGFKPVEGAKVNVKLTAGNKTIDLITGATDKKGTLSGTFQIPGDMKGAGTLKVSASSNIGQKELSFNVNLNESSGKIYLSTDKPLYQPGQNINIRVLALKDRTLKPVYPGKTLFEVYDPKGNKVFKKNVENTKFGVASAIFTLASEINTGVYQIKVSSGELTGEKSVTVKKYVLPKIKLSVETDKDYYLVGETLKGTLHADYFFGKPVEGGHVIVNAMAGSDSYFKVGTVEGDIDEKGVYKFDFPVPDKFDPAQLEAGNCSIQLAITVKDKADHKEKTYSQVQVLKNPITVQVMPEAGKLIPKLENRVYIITFYPDGTPAVCKLSVTSADQTINKELTTDKDGFAILPVTSQPSASIQLNVKAKDEKGLEVTRSVNLAADLKDKSLLLRLDKAIYNSGDKINLYVLSTLQKGTVYLDLIKDGQVVSTNTTELQQGEGKYALPLTTSTTGSLTLRAYWVSGNGDLVQDNRNLYVNPGNDLKVGVELNKKSYLPGEEAKLNFEVMDEKGKGAPSVLEVQLVDESLFALAGRNTGLVKLFFNLTKELLDPKFQIAEKSLSDLIQEGDKVNIQTLAQILFTQQVEQPAYSIFSNTYKNKVDKVYQNFNAIYQGYYKYFSIWGFSKDFPSSADILVKEGCLEEEQAYDPWGRPYLLSSKYPQIICVGADGIKGTEDDIDSAGYFKGDIYYGYGIKDGPVMDMQMETGNASALSVAQNKSVALEDTSGGKGKEVSKTSLVEGGKKPVRVREYFPETLYYNPLVVTDDSGKATVSLAMADSITTWRLEALASSLQGELGQLKSGVKVFQDFFIDIDLPVSLTQNDEISIPVAVYNYLPGKQDIKLEIESSDWFELKDEKVKRISLSANQVDAVYFRLKVNKVGTNPFTIKATGSQMSDAIKKSVEVLPDGKEYIVYRGDRLKGNVSTSIDIPQNAIPGASKILVTIYPGVFSQIAEGMENIFSMPGG